MTFLSKLGKSFSSVQMKSFMIYCNMFVVVVELNEDRVKNLLPSSTLHPNKLLPGTRLRLPTETPHSKNIRTCSAVLKRCVQLHKDVN